MAGRAGALAGWVALAGVGFLCLAPLAALLAQPGQWPQAYALGVLRFTLWQAALSALISVGLAIPLSAALVHRRFAGKQLLLTLLGAPFLLPVVVAVFGLLAVWGRSGWISSLLGVPIDIYGLPGLLLVHVFFNLPLATRLILQGWAMVPPEHLRLSAQLGLGWRGQWRVLGAPILRATLPGALLVVFLFCVTSFAAALILGGGPKATTVELAIYQALRLEFNLGGAARLALVQLGICLIVGALALRAARPVGFGTGLALADIALPRARWMVWGDRIALILAAAFLMLPMLAIVLNGIDGFADMPAAIWAALLRSVTVALGSGVLAVCTALAIAALLLRLSTRSARAIEAAVMLALAASPFVLGTGLFILLNPVISPARVALLLTGLINAVLILPILLRLFIPALAKITADYGQLCAMCALENSARLRHVTLPLLARPLGLGMGLAVALSMGDLGVITLFAAPDSGTLPMVMQRLMGAYRGNAAAGAGLVLVSATMLLFYVFDRLGARFGHRI
ncbi:MAG: thiamine/thiamine pyrophosphate ABC transporter permease ThiP [Paracoccaceae bacterium]